ncbi:gliding motility-associated C-terminal domain-containing protein, partial [Algibacter sp.]|uniref:gliding motility-associated C-terminal domain-containing protein n=1 Tax=Algibacter sp. TaxID=1872428 RepID=UPI003C70AE15
SDPTPVDYNVEDNDGNVSNDATITLNFAVEVSFVTSDSQLEGTDLVHTVTMSGSSATPETYTYTLTDNTTDSATDYSAATFSDGVVNNGDGTITVPAGVTSFTVTSATTDDALSEGNEFYDLVIDGVTATGTIIDGDSVVVITVTDATVTEGTDLVHTVTLSVASATDETFTYILSDNTTDSATDYSAATFSDGVTYDSLTGLITVPAGVISFTVTVPTTDDTLLETSEYYNLVIDSIPATGTILDNDDCTSNPNTDCDGDGVTNGDELFPPDGETPTNPNDPCDYLASDVTVSQGGDWSTSDCDGDGTTNENEIPGEEFDPCADDGTIGDEDTANTIYLTADCDGDGVTNGDELTPPGGETPTDPNDSCDYNTADMTLTPDVLWLAVDCDGDGVTNGDELTPSNGETPTDPLNPCDFNEGDITLTPTATGCLASMEVTKTAQVFGTSLGDEIEYTIEVENTGNVVITSLTLEDIFLDANGNAIALTVDPVFVSADQGSPEGTLLVGEIAIYTASFDITQVAINSGGVSNSVIATGTSLSGPVNDTSDNGIDTDGNTSDDSTVTELGCLTVINEFSPNGDNFGDTLIITCIDNYPNNKLEIYNRWGNIVYLKRHYKNDEGWDGTSNGRVTLNEKDKLPEGTYYYVLDLGDGSEPKAGWIYINR